MDEDSLEYRAALAGVSAVNFGDGSDGDALALLFKNAWWAVIEVGEPPHDMADEHGPYASRDQALVAGLALVS